MFDRRRVLLSLMAVCLLLGLWVLFNGNSRLFSRTARSAAGSERTVASSSRGSENQFTRSSFAPRGRVEDEWTRRWRALCAEPRTPARDEDLVTFIEELAAIDPRRAISLAQIETDSALRTDLFEAAMRGWGKADPAGAIEWAVDQTLLDPSQALAAVFHGLVRDPEEALRFVQESSKQNPAWLREYGGYLVAAFSRSGEFEHAAAFAAQAPVESRVNWLNVAYGRWADSQPKMVLERIAQLADPNIHQIAFDVAVSHWAKNDPRAAAEYAITLGEGHDRTFGLSAALRQWAAKDPVEAATWILRFDPSREFDLGAAMIASGPEGMLQPKVATDWAESIVDQKLRVRVLASIVNAWAATDPVAARQYVETSSKLQNVERTMVLSAFEPGFNPISLSP